MIGQTLSHYTEMDVTMKNSKWMLNDFMTIFVLMMILFSSPWLAAKGKLTISSVDVNGDMMTLFGEFEPGPSKKSAELVVTLDGVIPLDFILVSDTEIEAMLPSGLVGTHRVAVCKAKDKECPNLERHQAGNQIDVTLGQDHSAAIADLQDQINELLDLIGAPILPSGPSVFVTSSTFTGNLGGISGADAKCQQAAANASLPGTWLAWISDPNQDAVDQIDGSTSPFFPTAATPLELPDGSIVANSVGDIVNPLCGSGIGGVASPDCLLNPINVDEFGQPVTGFAWTGTSGAGRTTTVGGGLGGGGGSGGSALSCPTFLNLTGAGGAFSFWTSSLSTAQGLIGSTSSTVPGWTDHASSPCVNQQHLYCFRVKN